MSVLCSSKILSIIDKTEFEYRRGQEQKKNYRFDAIEACKRFLWKEKGELYRLMINDKTIPLVDTWYCHVRIYRRRDWEKKHCRYIRAHNSIDIKGYWHCWWGWNTSVVMTTDAQKRVWYRGTYISIGVTLVGEAFNRNLGFFFINFFFKPPLSITYIGFLLFPHSLSCIYS